MKVSFFGKGNIEESVLPYLRQKLKEFILHLIALGATEFFFGGRGEFDYLAAEIVGELKQEFPFLKRTYCYASSKEQYSLPKFSDRSMYDDFVLLDFYEQTFKVLHLRNCAMVNVSDFCVFYVDENAKVSGSKLSFEYALKKKKPFVNLWF